MKRRVVAVVSATGVALAATTTFAVAYATNTQPSISLDTCTSPVAATTTVSWTGYKTASLAVEYYKVGSGSPGHHGDLWSATVVVNPAATSGTKPVTTPTGARSGTWYIHEVRLYAKSTGSGDHWEKHFDCGVTPPSTTTSTTSPGSTTPTTSPGSTTSTTTPPSTTTSTTTTTTPPSTTTSTTTTTTPPSSTTTTTIGGCPSPTNLTAPTITDTNIGSPTYQTEVFLNSPGTWSPALGGACSVTYQWQTASSSAGPWTDIDGANSTSYVTPNNCNIFRLKMTEIAAGGGSDAVAYSYYAGEFC